MLEDRLQGKLSYLCNNTCTTHNRIKAVSFLRNHKFDIGKSFGKLYSVLFCISNSIQINLDQQEYCEKVLTSQHLRDFRFWPGYVFNFKAILASLDRNLKFSIICKQYVTNMHLI